MSETLHSQNHVRIVVEMQSENNAISKSAKVKADTKTNTMKTVALNGLGLSVTVAVEQQKPIATNINQRIIGTMGKQKGEPMDLIDRQAAIDAMFELCDEAGPLKINPMCENPHIDSICDALEELPPAQPDKSRVEDCLYHIHRNTSVHTSAEGVVAIKHYMGEMWRELFGEEDMPEWMI